MWKETWAWVGNERHEQGLFGFSSFGVFKNHFLEHLGLDYDRDGSDGLREVRDRVEERFGDLR